MVASTLHSYQVARRPLSRRSQLPAALPPRAAASPGPPLACPAMHARTMALTSTVFSKVTGMENTRSPFSPTVSWDSRA